MMNVGFGGERLVYEFETVIDIRVIVAHDLNSGARRVI